MVVPIRCFKTLICLSIAFMCLTTKAQSSNFTLSPADQKILEQSKSILDGSGANLHMDDGWMEKAEENVEKHKHLATSLMNEIRQTNPMLSHAKGVNSSDISAKVSYNTLIFVSYAMGTAALNEALRVASQDPDIAIVLRGVPDNMDVMSGLLQVQALAAGFSPVPNVVLDPTLFKDHNIYTVPTIVAFEERRAEVVSSPLTTEAVITALGVPVKHEQITMPETIERVEIARVMGLYDPSWLRRSIEAGELGDLGVRGPVQDIKERDLIEVMQEKVLSIDWEEKRENALRNYWRNQSFINLEKAPEERVRRIDASVIATADIRTTSGEFVARAGDVVNPLDTRPFTQAIVVFDSTDQKQIKLLKERLPRIAQEPGVARLVYIATRIDKEEGWDAYEELTKQFSAPIFLLTTDVQSRFALQYTPSVITADSTHFIIREWSAGEEENVTPD